MKTQNGIRRESAAWNEIYRKDILVKRRLATHAKKLEKLGLFSESRDRLLLDVSCGAGEMLDLLAERGFFSLCGLDLECDEKIRENLRTKKWRYVAGSGTHLPFKDKTFDWILCAHSLHHLWPATNVEMFFRDAYRCLRHDGKLALIDHYDSFQLRMALTFLLSPMAGVTEWARAFREQYLEEKEILFDYLGCWKSIHEIIERLKFKTFSYRRDLFFFYWVVQK